MPLCEEHCGKVNVLILLVDRVVVCMETGKLGFSMKKKLKSAITAAAEIVIRVALL